MTVTETAPLSPCWRRAESIEQLSGNRHKACTKSQPHYGSLKQPVIRLLHLDTRLGSGAVMLLVGWQLNSGAGNGSWRPARSPAVGAAYSGWAGT
jgi:hypothetical protein